MVKNRLTATPIPNILEYIEPGGIIVSDSWRTYFDIGSNENNHLMVNHSQNHKNIPSSIEIN
ncbi:hypothetical protein HZS_1757 [Henneguya salminicola]|nr:hypothetical protein HZS_1757 [Henneguya salminicola]